MIRAPNTIGAVLKENGIRNLTIVTMLKKLINNKILGWVGSKNVWTIYEALMIMLLFKGFE